MSMVNLFKAILRNLFVFSVGAVIGIMAVVRFIFPVALKETLAENGPGMTVLGAIAIAPVLLIIYGVLGIILGGSAAIVIYNIVELILRRRKANKSC